MDRGRPKRWLHDGRFAPVGALFGMAADPRRNRLWVAETFGGGLPGQSGATHTGLLEIELSSGRLIARHPAVEDGRKRMLGDVVLGRDGSVYASDSASGGIYRLKPKRVQIELLVDTGLKSPQGLVLSADGSALLLADYPTGLHRLDLATGKIEALAGNSDRLRGVDALTRAGPDLVATQNGGSPNRVLRIRLSADERAVRAVEILAEGGATDDLSLGTMIGKNFVFVAHSQWSAVEADGAVTQGAPPATLSSLIVLPVPGRR